MLYRYSFRRTRSDVYHIYAQTDTHTHTQDLRALTRLGLDLHTPQTRAHTHKHRTYIIYIHRETQDLRALTRLGLDLHLLRSFF